MKELLKFLAAIGFTVFTVWSIMTLGPVAIAISLVILYGLTK